MRAGWICHELYFWHFSGPTEESLLYPNVYEPIPEEYESPETKRRLRNLVEVSGLLEHLTALRPEPAGDDALLRFHTPGYVARVKEISRRRGGAVGPSAFLSAGGYEIAALAAGGCITAVDAVLDHRVTNAYALVRPPGHHALADSGMGYCTFNNVVVAALHARLGRGLERVAIVDFDVHHGNGTQTAFYGDPSVLTISLHQDGLYPGGSGRADEIGEGEGLGANLNIPLPPGSGAGAYREAFLRLVAPALRAHKPQLILVSCGFDAAYSDPLGRMLMHSDGFRTLTRILKEVAHDVCADRLVFCHEGGYSAEYVPFCGLATLEELCGVRTGVSDPFLDRLERLPGQELQPHQAEVIRRLVRNWG